MEVQPIDLDYVRRFAECLLDIAVFEYAIPDFVSSGRVVKNALVLECLLGIDNRFERVILHLNQFGRIIGDCCGLGHYGGHGLALVSSRVDGQWKITNFGGRSWANLDERLGQRLNLFSCQGADHARQCFRSRDVDAHNSGMGIRRAHEAQVQHLPHLHVVGKFASATKKARFFLPRNRFADPAAILPVVAHTASGMLDVPAGPEGASDVAVMLLNAACRPLISFCTFFLANGSSNPPATEVSRPKICASPCQATLVPSEFGDRSNPATSEVFPPATLPCPLYCARVGRSACASSIFTFAVPLICDIPTFTFTVKCVGSSTVIPWNSGNKGANLLGSVRNSYTWSGVFFTSNSPENLIGMPRPPSRSAPQFESP